MALHAIGRRFDPVQVYLEGKKWNGVTMSRVMYSYRIPVITLDLLQKIGLDAITSDQVRS